MCRLVCGGHDNLHCVTVYTNFYVFSMIMKIHHDRYRIFTDIAIEAG